MRLPVGQKVRSQEQQATKVNDDCTFDTFSAGTARGRHFAILVNRVIDLPDTEEPLSRGKQW